MTQQFDKVADKADDSCLDIVHILFRFRSPLTLLLKQPTWLTLWIFVVFLGGLTINDIISSLAEYGEHPTFTSTKIAQDSVITLPNISICIEYRFVRMRLNKSSTVAEILQNLQKFEKMNSYDELRNHERADRPFWYALSYAYELVIRRADLVALSDLQFGKGFHDIYDPIHERLEGRWRFENYTTELASFANHVLALNFSLPKFASFLDLKTSKSGFGFGNFENIPFARHRFESETFASGVTSYKSRITMSADKQQRCESVIYNSNSMQRKELGAFLSFNMKLNLDIIDFGKRIEDVHVPRIEDVCVNLLVGTPLEGGQYNEIICPGAQTYVTISKQTVYRMLENDENKCADDADYFVCREECNLKKISRQCRCDAAKFANDEKIVFPDYNDFVDGKEEAFSNERDPCYSECRRNCTTIHYSTAARRVPSRFAQRIKVEFSWDSFQYLMVTEKYKYESFGALASEVGGSLGVWLGLSTFSIIQALLLLYEHHKKALIRKFTCQSLAYLI